MADAMETMRTRRSIRHYRPDPVPRELIDKVIEAGLYAPSGKNGQSTIILAVTDRETRDQLSRLNAEIMEAEPGTDPFYGAPAVLVVLADRSYPNWQYDGPVVMENLLLAAHALGLGACWIHRAKQTFARPEGQAILQKLGVEGDFEGIGNCILGWPDGDLPAPAPRKDGRVFWME